MKLNGRSNLKELERTLDDVGRRQLPFALAKGLTATAEAFQKRQREGMTQRFTLRRRSWAHRSVKIAREDRATKKKLQATVRLETPGDASRSNVLGQHEAGGQKRPRRGKTISIPDKARRGGYGGKGAIPEALRPAALNLRPWGESGRVMRGDQRTVLIRTGNDRGVILQRTGKGKRAKMKVLYRLKGAVPLKPSLQFFRTAQLVADDELLRNVRRELERAIATAKVR